MTWWQLAAFVVGSICILAVGIVTSLAVLWRRQEQRDGLR